MQERYNQEEPTCLNNLLSVFSSTPSKRVLSQKRVVRQKKIHLSLNEDKKSKTSRKLTVSSSFYPKPTPSTEEFHAEQFIQSKAPSSKYNRGLNFHPRKISFNNQSKSQLEQLNQLARREISSEHQGTIKIENKNESKEKIHEINRLVDKKAPIIPNNPEINPLAFNKTNIFHSSGPLFFRANEMRFDFPNFVVKNNKKVNSPSIVDSCKEEDTPETTILERFKEAEDDDLVFIKEELSDVKSYKSDELILQPEEQLSTPKIRKKITDPQLGSSSLVFAHPIKTLFERGTVNSHNDESSQRSESYAFSNVIERINTEEMMKEIEGRFHANKFGLNKNLVERFSENFDKNNIPAMISRHTEGPTETIGLKKKNTEERPRINVNENEKRLNYIEEESNAEDFKESNFQSENKKEEQIRIQYDASFKGIYEKFLKVRYLGVGRFASVYLCCDERIGFIFAMKEILKFTIEANGLSNQIKKEIETQYSCSHPHIATLYGAWKDEKKYYLAIEYGQETLLKKIETNSIHEDDCLEYIKQIALGLEYLHEKRIVHRDIKPENIILVNGVCKIADFGWATRNNEEILEESCGTPCYISPQMEMGEKYSFKTDSWSLGILAYELINGKLDELYFSRGGLQRESLRYDRNVSEGFRELVYLLLAPNEEDRPSIKELLGHEVLNRK